MAQHTPGPWIAAPHSSIVGAPVVARDGKVVASVRYAFQPGMPQGVIDQCAANGRLIAAAPDLLAALRAASEVLVQDDCPMIYAQVQKALALAEGRT